MICHSDQLSPIIDIRLIIVWRLVIYQTCYDELAIYWLQKIKYVSYLFSYPITEFFEMVSGWSNYSFVEVQLGYSQLIICKYSIFRSNYFQTFFN